MQKLTLLAAVAGLLAMPALAPPAAAQQLDLDEVFRCSEETVSREDCLASRDIILNNCTTCHTFVPIVMQPFDGDGWRGLLVRHIENGRANQLSEDQVETLRLYLAENFNGDLPPPDLPASLLATWTAY